MEKFFVGIWLLAAMASRALAASYQHDFDGVLDMPLYVGTPPQGPFYFRWTPSLIGPFKSLDYPEVPRGNDYFKGFDPMKSTTFTMGGMIPDGQFRGTDVFQFGENGAKVPMMDVKVMGYRYEPDLTLRTDGSLRQSFVGQALAGLGGDFTIVMAVKQSFGYKNTTGSIVLGNAKPSVCLTDWVEFPASYYMGLSVNDIQIGKTHLTEKFDLSFSENTFATNNQMFKHLSRELGIDRQRRIDCNQKKTITLKAGGLEWTVGPATYLFFDKEENQCYYRGIYGEGIRLPWRHLNGKCMRYDYKKRTVSFATLRQR